VILSLRFGPGFNAAQRTPNKESSSGTLFLSIGTIEAKENQFLDVSISGRVESRLLYGLGQEGCPNGWTLKKGWSPGLRIFLLG